MKLNTKQKLIITIVLTGLFFSERAFAGRDSLQFNMNNRSLSGSGFCALPEVLVVVYKSGTDDVIGSFNTPCVNNSYTFFQDLTSWKIQDGDYEISIADGGYSKFQENKKKKNLEKLLKAGRLHITIAAPPLAPPPAIVAAESPSNTPSTSPVASVEFSSTTQETLAEQASLLEKLFGVLQAIEETIVRFTTLVAESVRTTLVTTVKLFSKDLALLPDGGIALPSGENQITGNAKVPTGQSTFFVQNTTVQASSRIFIAPSTAINVPLVVSKKVPGRGFEVSLATPADKEVSFDWIIFQSYGENVEGTNDQLTVPEPVSGESSNSGNDSAASGGQTATGTNNSEIPTSSAEVAPQRAPSSAEQNSQPTQPTEPQPIIETVQSPAPSQPIEVAQ